jgi:hypothetical protein
MRFLQHSSTVQAVDFVLQCVCAVKHDWHSAAVQRAELLYCSIDNLFCRYEDALRRIDKLVVLTALHCITELEPATTTASIAAKSLRQAPRT